MNGPAFRPPDNCFLPADFYDARPRLRHIRQAAHSRGRAADSVLLATVVRFATTIDHRWVLPPIVGGVGSLNMMGGLIGLSGSGKSSGHDVAEELVPFTDDIPRVPIGSGEGLAARFMLDDKATKPTTNAMFYADEGAVLVTLKNRDGATLAEQLRSAAHGQQIGQYNGNKLTRRVVNAHTYRLGFLAGFQPHNAGPFIVDKDTGTPQRFVFASTMAHNCPPPGERPAWPGPWQGWNLRTPDEPRTPVTVTDAIRDEVEWNAHERATGEVVTDTLDAHRDLGRLRLAALLAMFENRTHVTDDDWLWATVWWNTSANLRNFTEAWWAEHRGVIDKGKARDAGKLAAVREDARVEATVDRVARRMTRKAIETHKAGEGFVPKPAWAGRDARLLNDAKNVAIRNGWVTFDGARCLPGPNAGEVN
jgi:hypothetical protein